MEYGLGWPSDGGDAPLVYRMGQGSLTGELSVKDLAVELATLVDRPAVISDSVVGVAPQRLRTR